MFSFPYMLAYLSSLFWIFPAIRNYKTNLFYYFFILAISDPVVIVVALIKIGFAARFYLLFAFLTVVSLRKMFSNKTLYAVVIIMFFSLGAISAFTTLEIAYSVIIIDHLCVAFIFIGLLLSYVAINSKVKGYHIVLLLYETTLILKVLFMVLHVELGASYFYSTGIFQMLIAVFFSIYKETDEKLLIDLRNV